MPRQRTSWNELHDELVANAGTGEPKKLGEELQRAYRRKVITGREYEIVKAMFISARTTKEIADDFGISPTRVRDIGSGARDKLGSHYRLLHRVPDTSIYDLPWRVEYGNAGGRAASELGRILSSYNKPETVGGGAEFFKEASERGYLLEKYDRGYGLVYLEMTRGIFGGLGFELPVVALKPAPPARKSR